MDHAKFIATTDLLIAVISALEVERDKAHPDGRVYFQGRIDGLLQAIVEYRAAF